MAYVVKMENDGVFLYDSVTGAPHRKIGMYFDNKFAVCVGNEVHITKNDNTVEVYDAETGSFIRKF